MRFGVLGPAGTFSDLAFKLYIAQLESSSVSKRLFQTIRLIVESLLSGQTDKIIIPIENSVEGKVGHTLDELLRLKNHQIESEFIISINHCLLGVSEDVINNVEYIISHYQPLGQCREYLSRQFPNAEQIVSNSTAEAARFIAHKERFVGLPQECHSENTVVIGSQLLASEYELLLLESNVNDYPYNQTRFLVIGSETASLTGRDKTSLIFTTLNQSGELYEILGIFSKANINLLSIASRPSKKKVGEYLFYLDVEGHVSDEAFRRVLESVEKKAIYYQLLGSFKIGEELNC